MDEIVVTLTGRGVKLLPSLSPILVDCRGFWMRISLHRLLYLFLNLSLLSGSSQSNYLIVASILLHVAFKPVSLTLLSYSNCFPFLLTETTVL